MSNGCLIWELGNILLSSNLLITAIHWGWELPHWVTLPAKLGSDMSFICADSESPWTVPLLSYCTDASPGSQAALPPSLRLFTEPLVLKSRRDPRDCLNLLTAQKTLPQIPDPVSTNRKQGSISILCLHWGIYFGTNTLVHCILGSEDPQGAFSVYKDASRNPGKPPGHLYRGHAYKGDVFQF